MPFPCARFTVSAAVAALAVSAEPEEDETSEDTVSEEDEAPEEDAAPEEDETSGEDAAPEEDETSGGDSVPEEDETSGENAAPEEDETSGEDAAPEYGLPYDTRFGCNFQYHPLRRMTCSKRTLWCKTPILTQFYVSVGWSY